MINVVTGVERERKSLGKVRNYNEVIAYLDSLPTLDYSEKALARMKELDLAFDNICSQSETILVGGTNGKSTTIHFAAKLLKEEGFKVASIYSTHFLTYNERVVIDKTVVANKNFTESANDVINTLEAKNIKATAFEVMLIAGMLQSKAENCDITLIEVGMGGRLDASTIFNPKIVALSRVADDHAEKLGVDLDAVACEMIDVAKPGTWVISAEQSKLRLQKMKTHAENKNVRWAMPIRKLASLPYIFEQLYGRIASLGERIAQLYVEDIQGKFSPFLRGNLLATKKGQRGRPTIEAKRNAELNPIKTLKIFWREEFDLLRGRFEVLDKEKPTIVLDNAHNLDALTNVFLGIRLLHYQSSLKGLSLILGLKKEVDAAETLKLIRYLFKKVSGQVFFIPFSGKDASHSPDELATMAKELNIKAKACAHFAEAFDIARKTVDERNGVICLTGSDEIISEYWHFRGVKKI